MASGSINFDKYISGVRILKIEGHFTKETVPETKKVCYAAGKYKDTKGILLDLKEVTDIDTSAFACVIGFIKDQLTQGINVGVINLKRQEKALAELLKIDKAIQTFQTESEAIKTLSEKRNASKEEGCGGCTC